MISDAEEKRIKRVTCKYIRSLSNEKTEELGERIIALLNGDFNNVTLTGPVTIEVKDDQ